MSEVIVWSRNMISPSELPEGSTGLLAAIGAFFGGVLWIRKKFSRVELVKDETEVNLIKTLIEERDKARLGEAESRGREDAAWRARNDDAKMIGELSAEVRNFRSIEAERLAQIKELTEQVHTLRKEIHNMRDELQVYRNREGMRGVANG
jgi:hypothetical protein